MRIIEFTKKHHRLVLIALALILIIAAIAYFSLKRSSNIYEVKRDNFEAVVSCKGEIQIGRASCRERV